MPIQPIHQRDKNSDGIEPSPVPGLAPTGLLPLTAAQEAVLARLDDRIKATPITAREPSVHMAAGSQVVASPAMSSVTPATGSTQEQSWYLPSIVGEPRYRVMATCETLESLASVQQVPDQNVLNWGMVDSIWGENGAVNTAGVLHPKNLYDLAASVRSVEQLGETARAFGSLFSFSDAVFPLPNEPTGPNPKTSGHSIDTSQLNKSLQQLLPGIGVTNTGFTPDRYFFVEAGIKLYDLNMALDQHGLALPTLGGSAGQSLAGAISTGTHGCDFDRPPIADAVVGLYLVGAGGTHHWIEGSLPVTDPEKLQAVFPCLQSENIHYDSDMLHAVQVSFGSMGVIYAALLRVVPQYTLVQLTRRGTWEGLIQSKSQGGAGTDLSDAMNGTWSGLNAYLDMIYPPASNQRLERGVFPIASAPGRSQSYQERRWQPHLLGDEPCPGSGALLGVVRESARQSGDYESG